MAATCPHGFAPDACLICRTLDPQRQVQVETSPAREGVGRRLGRGKSPAPIPLSGSSAVRPAEVYPPDASQRRLQPVTHHLLLGVAALLAIGAAVWLLTGVAFAIFHLIELLLVAAVAGWAGYRLGHWRGRREGR